MSSFRLPLFMIFLLLIPYAVDAATIHGTVYEWSTFEPLDNALVEVNSTPVQFRVAVSGVYSFNLPPGVYLIKASYYTNDTLEYYAEDTLTVTDYEGDYVFDILLFPLQNEKEDFPDEDIGNVTIDLDDEGTLPGFNWTYTAGAVLILVIIAAAAYYFGRKKPVVGPEPVLEMEAHQESVVQKAALLPDDLKEVIEIIERAGGRITQKELRKKLRCSEAKVSLMITDLEDRGVVRKIKKGRGNIILLNHNDDL